VLLIGAAFLPHSSRSGTAFPVSAAWACALSGDPQGEGWSLSPCTAVPTSVSWRGGNRRRQAPSAHFPARNFAFTWRLPELGRVKQHAHVRRHVFARPAQAISSRRTRQRRKSGRTRVGCQPDPSRKFARFHRAARDVLGIQLHQMQAEAIRCKLGQLTEEFPERLSLATQVLANELENGIGGSAYSQALGVQVMVECQGFCHLQF